MLQSPGKPAGLEQEDLLAPLSALGVRCRHKGVWVHHAVRQIILCIGHRARLYRRAGLVLKGHILPPLGIQLLHIHIGNGEHAFPANRSPSAKMPPFSATKVAPLNTRSVVLSCTPAPAYTYPATQRAD